MTRTNPYEGTDSGAALIFDTLCDREVAEPEEIARKMREYASEGTAGDFWNDFVGPMIDRVELVLGFPDEAAGGMTTPARQLDESSPPPRFHRVAAGDYETADGKYVLRRLLDTHPPAWNVEFGTDWVNAQIDADPERITADDFDLIVDGAATKRDALALFALYLEPR